MLADHMKKELNRLGYSVPTSMDKHIKEWLGWFLSDNDFYNSESASLSADHISISPARMIVQEWASLIFNDKTTVSADDEIANEWIQENFEGFASDSADLIETTFALGTGAWALRPTRVTEGEPNSEMGFEVESYDATEIFPLSYRGKEVYECAFTSRTTLQGKEVEQLRLHVLEDGIYHIKTLFFEKSKLVNAPEDVATDVNTYSTLPTFALISPNISNSYDRYSPYGVSVFDDAIGAIKLVDEAVDTMFNYLFVGKPLLFLDDALIGKDPRTGKPVTYRKRDQQFFRNIRGTGDKSRYIESWSPDLQVDNTREAVSTALQVLSVKGGFGNGYFTLDKLGGIKTATEVNADNSALFRNISKHEKNVASALIQLVEGAMELCRNLRGDVIPECSITVDFDDSITVDTASEKAQLLAEIAAGVAQPWEYRVRFYGEDEETARLRVAQPAEYIDNGF